MEDLRSTDKIKKDSFGDKSTTNNITKEQLKKWLLYISIALVLLFPYQVGYFIGKTVYYFLKGLFMI